MIKCPHCGFSHADHVEVCPITGQPIQPAHAPAPPPQPKPANLITPQQRALPGQSRKRIGILCVTTGSLGMVTSLVLLGLGLFNGGEQPEPAGASRGASTSPTQVINPTEGALVQPGAQSDQPETNRSSTATQANHAQQPTEEQTPTPDATPTTAASPTLAAAEPIDTRINSKDGMTLVLVPEGTFIMGSDPGTDPYFWGAEGPSHEVFLRTYWIYQTEVTNTMYQECVAAQACPRPLRVESRTHEDYYLSPTFYDYPVIQVNWIDAVAYCQWAGGRLPTEAEWEKAARGTDGRLFPWGNNPPGPNLVSACGTSCPNGYREPFDDGYPELAPVGSFPAGASPYGALDMAGNVWEWVFDVFNKDYYSISPDTDPLGPVTGDKHVIRGGSWEKTAEGLRTVVRISLHKDQGLDGVGFRCVMDDEP